jgi:crotonobetainyl-CoA:carnitine CoA-transferase CaiB-like acyl-CoA transferase
LLGQHTRAVLAELGADDAQLAALEEAGVVETAGT